MSTTTNDRSGLSNADQLSVDAAPPTTTAAQPDQAHRAPTEARSASLSPSRAGDFMHCPLLYRFRVIDRLPEPPSQAALRGTLVHAVAENLFDLPAPQRTVDAARELLPVQWQRLRELDPQATAIIDDTGEDTAAWLQAAESLLQQWFTLEDPTRLEPAERELYVETTLDDGLVLRGYIDRLDISADGKTRIVDYKTGRAPSELYEARALFQMKFYGLVMWRLQGRIPSMLQLVYLGSGVVIRDTPDEQSLLATQRKIQAIWSAIQQAGASGDWRACPGKLCEWCHFQALCPAWGGTPPALPTDADQRIGSSHASLPTSPGLDEL